MITGIRFQQASKPKKAAPAAVSAAAAVVAVPPAAPAPAAPMRPITPAASAVTAPPASVDPTEDPVVTLTRTLEEVCALRGLHPRPAATSQVS